MDDALAVSVIERARYLAGNFHGVGDGELLLSGEAVP
jgi:hypothetical protein